MVTGKHWKPLPSVKVSLAGPDLLTEQDRAFVAAHEDAVQRLHPELRQAYDAYKRNGYEGSIYDYLPGNYRELLK